MLVIHKGFSEKNNSQVNAVLITCDLCDCSQRSWDILIISDYRTRVLLTPTNRQKFVICMHFGELEKEN